MKICIEMPSGAQSIHHDNALKLIQGIRKDGVFWYVSRVEPLTEDSIQAYTHKLRDVMLDWPDFKASIVLFEDDVEISRIHIDTHTNSIQSEIAQ